MSEAHPLRVSAVVPTRNRPVHAIPCVSTILANADALEVIVVDQSDDDATEQALASVVDPRLRYVRSELRGVTNGRNLGIELAKGDIVAYTDDDCRVAPDWIATLRKIFEDDPEVAVVCGRVHVPAELLAIGYAAQFEPSVREYQGSYPPVEADWGITANMSIRKRVVDVIGPFDPFLGAGAPLRSGGEPDFLFRALRDGFKVVNARECSVEHLGVRIQGDDSARLLKNYASGTAAAFFKYVRLGDVEGTKLYLRHLAGCGRMVLTNALHLHRPLGIGFTLAFLSGTASSFNYRVDPVKRVYSEQRG